ncbi:MAG TPA: hypothetical protein VI300_01035 [Solirubrobacter sp.]
MLVKTRRFAIAAVAAGAVGFPATALAADPASPRVIRIDPATGAQTVLAAGAPWGRLVAVAVAPSGTVYVADDRPNASGIYSLSAPGYAITPLATTVPTTRPMDLAATDSTVYSLDGDAGVVSIATTAPFAQKILSPPQVVGEGDPDNPFSFTLSGSTLFGVSSPDCLGEDSAGESSPASVVAIDTATGDRTFPSDLGCADPGPVAAAPDGTLLIAMPAGDRLPASIVRISPAGGPSSTVAKGGLLRDPVDLTVTPSGDVIVADLTSGVLRISPRGKQSAVASGGNLNWVNRVAADAGGAIYAIAPGGPAAVLNVSAPVRERFSKSGVAVTASCTPRCTLGYSMRYRFSERKGSLARIGAKRSVRLKFPAQLQRSVAKRLRSYKTAAVTLTMRPQDGRGKALGQPLTMTVTLTR